MKINYKRIYWLLNSIKEPGMIDIKERLEIWVSSVSHNRTSKVSELREDELAVMMLEMEQTMFSNSPEMRELDKWRRRVIRAICEYHELMGYYKDLPANERVEKAKGEAVKAKHPSLNTFPGGRETDTSVREKSLFNQLSVTDLQALYNAKLRQNRILRNANKAFEKDLMDV